MVDDEDVRAILHQCPRINRLSLNPNPATLEPKPLLTPKVLIIVAQTSSSLKHVALFLDPAAPFNTLYTTCMLDESRMSGYAFPLMTELQSLDLGATKQLYQVAALSLDDFLLQLFGPASVM